MATSLSIVIPVYNRVTHLDFTGPQQFFATTPGICPRVASVAGEPVRGDGLVFSELDDLEAIDRCDVLCVPGGKGAVAAMDDPRYMAAIRRLAATARYRTSVCNGSLILGAAGLLKGKRAACHWAWREWLKPLGAIPDPGRVVRDGNIITGGGVTAGIDFALTLIAEIMDDDTARGVQLGLEYAPQPPFNTGRPESAPPAILERVSAAMTHESSEWSELANRLGS